VKASAGKLVVREIDSPEPQLAAVEVSGDGCHFAIVVIGDIFAGLSPVKKQQLVYGALSEQFADGSIHAVDKLVTLTRAEHQRQQQ